MSQPNDSQVVQVAALRFYPLSTPADSDLQLKLQSLWSLGTNFVILSGPPGVGKTRAAEDYVADLIRLTEANHTKDECRVETLFPQYRTRLYTRADIYQILTQRQIKFVWDFCVLHPQYTYEDLIRGYRMSPTTAQTLVVREGILGFMARIVSVLEQMRGESGHPLGTIVMDEINRAPVGQLFGEAMYAVDRRGESVSTPYELESEGSQITIPKSLLILGTMNSIDRATSGFDFALRRRITLLNVGTRREVVAGRSDRFGEEAKTSMLSLYDKLKRLVMNAEREGIVPQAELVIGHSYFIPPLAVIEDDQVFEWLAKTYLYRILPTILDYSEQGLLLFKDAEDLLQLKEILDGQVLLGDIDEESVRVWLKGLGTSGANSRAT